MASLDPYKNENWCEVPDSDQGDVDAAVAAAKAAFHSPEWAKMSATARGALLRRVGDLIAENADRLAEIEVRDNGKLLGEMRIQLQTIPQWYYYYAGLADKIEGAVLPIDKPDQFVFTRWEPLGVVAAITAWNSPLLLLTWKLAPGLAAGNTFVIKPSEFTSASTVAFAELFELAGFPPGVVNVVCGTGQNVGAPLVSHPDIAKIAFTGSDTAGKAINKAAAGDLKQVTLELGGKSPNIVFEDADFDAALAGVASGIFAAAGQTCIAGSRLLLQRSIYDTFLQKLRTMMQGVKIGDPFDAETQIGPLANLPHYNKVLSCIDDAKKRRRNRLLGRQGHRTPQRRTVRGTDHLQGRLERLPARPAGDIRTRACRHPLRGRRRGAADCQWLQVWAGRRRMDQGYGARLSHVRRDPVRDCVDKYLSGAECHGAVRRDERQRPGARERAGDDQVVLAGEDRLDQQLLRRLAIRSSCD